MYATRAAVSAPGEAPPINSATCFFSSACAAELCVIEPRHGSAAETVTIRSRSRRLIGGRNATFDGVPPSALRALGSTSTLDRPGRSLGRVGGRARLYGFFSHPSFGKGGGEGADGVVSF